MNQDGAAESTRNDGSSTMMEHDTRGIDAVADEHTSAAQAHTHDLTAHDAAAQDDRSAAEFWEARYADADRVWSGRVNRVLADTADALPPARAIDLGCGEGGDAIWLAQHGWDVLGVDLSPTAVERSRTAAEGLGITNGSVRFEAADLETWRAPEPVELVSASFLHSWPVTTDRAGILRAATTFVAPGGVLLVVSHAAAPPWADPELVHEHRFPTPQEDLDALALDPAAWDVVTCELREREGRSPAGETGTLLDGVVLVRRRAEAAAE